MKKSYLLPLLFLSSGLLAQKSALPTADKTAPPLDPTQFQGPPPDTEPPTILCQNGVNVNLVQSGLITLWASDFLQSVEDNVTPAGEIKIGIRKSGTGTGFPVDGNGNPVSSVTYDCLQLGAQSIELWAIDAAGNAAYCETVVLIQDDFSYCSAGYDSFQVCVHFGCNGAPMVGVRMELYGNPIFQPPFFPVIDSITGPDGCVRLLLQPTNNTYVISATKEDDVLNGLTTHDLLLIGKHILGIEPLDNPYKMIAADINKSGSITSFDLVELRKLITGIYSEWPNNTAWRFVDGDFAFPNPNNPFLSAYPEYLSVQDGQLLSTELIGIKIGDVDCSANVDSLAPPDYPDALLAMPDTILQAGLVYDIPLYMLENGGWQGYQFKLDFDAQKLEYQSMVYHNLTGPSNWNTMLSSVGALTTSWVQYDVPGGFGPGAPIAIFRFRALETVALKAILSLGNAIRPEGYAGLSAEKRDLLLTFVPQFTPAPGSPSAAKNSSSAVPGLLGDTVSIGLPSPNPTNGATSLPIYLPAAQNLHLEISDLAGRLYWSNDQDFEPGNHDLIIPASTLPGAGMYVWRVCAGSLVKSGKIIRQP